MRGTGKGQPAFASVTHERVYMLGLYAPAAEEITKLSASEAMFYLSAPLAHVVEYEQRMREQTQRAAMSGRRRKVWL